MGEGAEIVASSLIKIKELLTKLSPSERKAAQFILNNPSRIADLSIGELSEKCGASEATIVRLCKILDYKGYKDFKLSLTKHISQIQREAAGEKYTDVKPGDDLRSIMQNISYNNRKSIEDTMQIISIPSMRKAIEALIAAPRIEFYAVGTCHIIAEDAMLKFSGINKIANAFSDSHMQMTSATNLKKGDVAVAISYSGETKDTYDTIKVAKESRATTISITKYGQSPISNICDINLFVSAPEISIRRDSLSSRIAQLNLVDILFAGVTSRSFETVKKYLQNTNEAIDKKMLK